MKRIKKIWISLLLVFVCVFSFAIAPFGSSYTYTARAESVAEFEVNNVLDDLKGMTLDGKAFDVKDYAFDSQRDVQIISFVEYCYSYVSDKQSDYGLYLYLWNPKGLSFVNDGTRNRVQFTYGETNQEPGKYPFTILNKSEESGCEGLFYKLRVDLTEEQKLYMLATMNSVSRTYHVSGIEILEKGATIASDYTISSTYTYSGFAAGYGPGDSTESTLTCTRDNSEVLELDVHTTYYRVDGSNGTNSYTQDTLMTAYFSVPNKVLNQYDKLSGFECSWIKLMTDWAFFTGNKAVYDSFAPFIGVAGLSKNMGTTFNPDFQSPEYGFVGKSIEGDYVVGCQYPGTVEYDITQLDYLFFAEGGVDAADNYILSSKEIYEWMNSYYDNYITDDSSNKKYLTVDGSNYPPYAETLFLAGSMGATVKEDFISVDKEYTLLEEKITQNWWQAIWGDTTLEYSNRYDGIEGIHLVTSEDMKATSDTICKNLYISPMDIDEFIKFYQAETMKDRTVLLLRYDIGEYVAVETTEGKPDSSGFTTGLTDTDTNCRVFRQDVYLNFDLIYVEFEKEGEAVIIPIVSSPKDVIADSTPPLHTTSDEDNPWDKLMKVVYIILGLLLLFVLFPLLQGIVSIVVGFCVSVVKTIGRILSSIFNLFKNR